MKKLIILFVALLTLTACGSSKSQFNTVDMIKEKGELVLLTESGFPPFEYASQDEDAVDGVAGVDIDFGKALADKLGVTLKVVDMDFDGLTIALNSNKGDLIAAGLTINPDRQKVVDFTEPYYANELYMIVQKGSSIKTKEDLVDIKVAVQQGTTGNNYANTLDVEVLEFKGMVEAAMAVNAGNAEAAIVDILTAMVIVRNTPELDMIETSLSNEELAYAVAKGNDSLLKVMNEVLEELKAEDLDKIFDYHFEKVAGE